MTKKLILSASPRAEGRSSHLAHALLKNFGQEGTQLFSLADHKISPCAACDACRENYQCIIEDDMQLFYSLLSQVEELIIVSPVFFAGPPAQFKAFLDRLQPYFWKQRAQGKALKRPASLYVFGEGGDPHGFSSLVVSTRSALAVAGFSLQDIFAYTKPGEEGVQELLKNPEAYRYQGGLGD